jgi:hypothetical protein
MKKILLLLLVLLILIIGGGVWYLKTERKDTSGTPNVPIVSTTTTYTDSNTGISFTYPSILMRGKNKNDVILGHTVPFVHHDYCDFKGESTSTIPMLTDFQISMHVKNSPLTQTIKSESPYIPQENFVNGEIVESPGFIDSVKYKNLEGFSIFEGAEGCGHVIYYFPIASDKTLVVKRDFITIFSGAIDAEEGKKALQVPGVISKQKEQEIFDGILNSLKAS